MAYSDAIKIYSDIFQLIKKRELNENDHFSGFVDLSHEVIKDLNILVEYDLCDTSVDLYNNDKLQTSIGIDALCEKHFPFVCKITLPSQWERGGYFIGDNWNLLLKSATRILKPVQQAFFTETNELTKEESLHFKSYIKLSKVCNFIDEVALPTNNDSSARTVIFERDINIFYTLQKSDLEHELSTEAIDRLLHKDLHHEAKVALVREALVKFLKDKGTNQRFGYLISHFNAFSSDLLLSYQGYVEKYTFDKVRKEYQEKQTEYIQKVNSTYSDIGAKVLAIPAGLWLAVFKLEEAKVGSFDFIKNIIIFTLCALCMGYAIFHFYAQFSTLESLKNEYQSLFDRLAKEHNDESKSIIKAKERIDTCAEKTWWKLSLSIFSTGIVFIMVIALSWYSLASA